MASTVTYEGDTIQTTLRGKYKLILTVTATGANTFNYLVQLQRRAGTGSMTWHVQNSHTLSLHYMAPGDNVVTEHSINIVGKLVEVPNIENGIADINSGTITINSACTAAQRKISAHYHASGINTTKDTYDFWAPSNTDPGDLPALSNVYVYNNGWHQATAVYVYNGGWKRASSDRVNVYNNGWKS